MFKHKPNSHFASTYPNSPMGFSDKCYKYTATPTKCDKSKKIIGFA